MLTYSLLHRKYSLIRHLATPVNSCDDRHCCVVALAHHGRAGAFGWSASFSATGHTSSCFGQRRLGRGTFEVLFLKHLKRIPLHITGFTLVPQAAIRSLQAHCRFESLPVVGCTVYDWFERLASLGRHLSATVLASEASEAWEAWEASFRDLKRPEARSLAKISRALCASFGAGHLWASSTPFPEAGSLQGDLRGDWTLHFFDFF